MRISTGSGAVLYSEGVVISDSHHPLLIHLPDEPKPVHPPSGSVSVQQLAHKAPPQARKAFEKGEQAEAKGKHQQAAEMFQHAVSIDPDYADAFNELGVAQAAQGQTSDAIESFQKAIDTAPEHPTALANLSIELAKAGRYDEAATAARRALQFMPASGKIRYILATSILAIKGDSDEVLENLERSANEIPSANVVAAEILTRRGKREEAAQLLEKYLHAAPSNDKERGRAEAMLAQLRS
jgi:tetratricopeptide (TPR) repeat protein